MIINCKRSFNLCIYQGFSKRDACCSPVRHFSAGSRSSMRVARRPGALRRSVAGRISSGIPPSCSADSGAGTTPATSSNVFSSDSDTDAGGEMFFVTNRRKRTASDDYDGGPEQSDTDHTF